MRRILIIANTYYQMILAIQMNETIFKKDRVVLLLSDHSKNTEIICNRLNTEQVFEKVHYIKTKNLVAKRSNFDKLKDYFDISFFSENRYSFYLEGVEDKYFDEIICYNYGIDIFGLHAIIYRSNPNVRVSLYEEGILSYGVIPENTTRRKIINASRHVLGKKSVYDVLENFYCFHPELYGGELKVVKVPEVMNGGGCAGTLKNIFALGPDQLEYPEKYIFFTSVYDFEGGAAIGEYQVVEQVADLVGKENLLVKTHPRDVRTVYTDNGFNVDKNSSIPWEAIQLSSDFSEKVFLTATSGSVLAGSFMAEKPVRTFYMFQLCDISNNASAQKNARDITNLINNENVKSALENVRVAKKIEDIL